MHITPTPDTPHGTWRYHQTPFLSVTLYELIAHAQGLLRCNRVLYPVLLLQPHLLTDARALLNAWETGDLGEIHAQAEWFIASLRAAGAPEPRDKPTNGHAIDRLEWAERARQREAERQARRRALARASQRSLSP